MKKPYSRLFFVLMAALVFLACSIYPVPATQAPSPPATQPPLPADTLPPEVTPIPPTQPPALGSIRGVLWHELCSFVDGSPPVLGEGCVQWGTESWEFGPNQIYDDFETGWEGVTMHLGIGACPSTGLETTLTNAAGEFAFIDLPPGTYCISYSNLTDGNDAILIPGGPTYPERGDGGFFQTVVLEAGQHLYGIDFGYAWQFYN